MAAHGEEGVCSAEYFTKASAQWSCLPGYKGVLPDGMVALWAQVLLAQVHSEKVGHTRLCLSWLAVAWNRSAPSLCPACDLKSQVLTAKHNHSPLAAPPPHPRRWMTALW